MDDGRLSGDRLDHEHEAYVELHGLIGEWRERYSVPYDRALLYLARITATLRWTLDCQMLARLQDLEEGQRG